MINVSNEFREVMKSCRKFLQFADITFSDGRTINLGPKDFALSNNSITDAAGMNTLPLGAAIAKSIQLEIINDKEQFADYDFLMAEIHLTLKLQLPSSVESVNKGTYTVITPETYGSTIIVEAVDDMYKADKDYATKLKFPATTGEMYRDICERKGFMMGSVTFLHDDFVVKTRPEGVTERQVLGYIAMIACGNARFDVDGFLKIQTYNFGKYIAPIMGSDRKYILDTNGKRILSVWGKNNKAHDLKNFSNNMKVGTDDVIITGVKTVIDENSENSNEIFEGNEGYVISISNPLITGEEKKVVSWLANELIGVRFRKFSGDHTADPTIEFMDLAYITSIRGDKRNTYMTVITDVVFNVFGYTSLSNSANDTLRNSSKYTSEATKAYVNAKNDSIKQLGNYESILQQITKLISQGSGMYLTPVEQEDGSIIYYMHDKPTIEESGYTCYWTSNGIIASLDGGTTWAVDKNGNALFNIITARGLIFDWLRGGTMKLGGDNNQNGMLKILNASGAEIAQMDNLGLNYNDNLLVGYNNNGRTNYPVIKETYTSGEKTTSCEIAQGSIFVYNDKGGTDDFVRKVYARVGTSLNYGYIATFNSDTGKTVVSLTNNIYSTGSLSCSGTKSRIAETRNYGDVKLYCYEMPAPMFGDIGEGRTDNMGECYIFLDDVFSETVNTEACYQVFLQKEDQGDIWVESKTLSYFVVKGTPNVKFSWEIKIKQLGFELERLELFSDEELMPSDAEEIDYEAQAATMVKEYYEGLEDMQDEEINKFHKTYNW
ncbi:hypothetical protein LIR51_26750 [Blautia producta]|uniref:hypothetical protein n=1 Tax=Blautia producta TaxID=33035 RepID=UPI001D04E44A|nr:hypothetical protein [Blautia producta]MCB5878411.1 hypothetical protein [Blautia producta]